MADTPKPTRERLAREAERCYWQRFQKLLERSDKTTKDAWLSFSDALIAAGVCFRDEVREEAAKECDEWAVAVKAVSLGNTHARGQLFAYRNAAAALRAKAAPTEGE